jgi:hypothetical protein
MLPVGGARSSCDPTIPILAPASPRANSSIVDPVWTNQAFQINTMHEDPRTVG